MYCKRCGKEIEHDARFCSGCGIQLKDMPQVEDYQDGRPQIVNGAYVEEREIVRRIDRALSIYQVVESMTNEIEILQKRKLGVSHTIAEDVVVSLAISAIIGAIAFLAIIGINPKRTYPFGTTGIVFLVALVVLFIIFRKHNNTRVIRIDRELQNKKDQVAGFIQENNIPEVNYLPEKYRYVIAAQYIRDCIVNCRAHNLTDAINLYEEQMYRWKMENYQYYQCVMSAQKGAVKVVVY